MVATGIIETLHAVAEAQRHNSAATQVQRDIAAARASAYADCLAILAPYEFDEESSWRAGYEACDQAHKGADRERTKR